MRLTNYLLTGMALQVVKLLKSWKHSSEKKSWVGKFLQKVGKVVDNPCRSTFFRLKTPQKEMSLNPTIHFQGFWLLVSGRVTEMISFIVFGGAGDLPRQPGTTRQYWIVKKDQESIGYYTTNDFETYINLQQNLTYKINSQKRKSFPSWKNSVCICSSLQFLLPLFQPTTNLHLRKLKWQWKSQPFEDVYPINNCDFTASHVGFRGSNQVTPRNLQRSKIAKVSQIAPLKNPPAFSLWCGSWEQMQLRGRRKRTTTPKRTWMVVTNRKRWMIFIASMSWVVDMVDFYTKMIEDISHVIMYVQKYYIYIYI